MSLKKFYQENHLTPEVDKEKEKFVQRINQTIFNNLKSQPYPDDYRSLLYLVCYKLGINFDDIIKQANTGNFFGETHFPHFRDLTHDNFLETLKILVILYGICKKDNKKRINDTVEAAIANSFLDIGVRWKNGMFYPSGAKELDEKLIDDNLDWLNDYPKTKEKYSSCLSHFSKSIEDKNSRKDAITNAYSAIEQLARDVLDNTINFDKNSNEFIKKIGLPKEYGNIINHYKIIANEYSSRHAGSDFGHNETEAFIYLTGILIRLSVQKI